MKDNEFFDDWEKVIRELEIGEIQKGEITIKMFAERAGLTVSGATRKLSAMYPKLATRRWVRENGQKVYAYRLKKPQHSLKAL